MVDERGAVFSLAGELGTDKGSAGYGGRVAQPLPDRTEDYGAPQDAFMGPLPGVFCCGWGEVIKVDIALKGDMSCMVIGTSLWDPNLF